MQNKGFVRLIAILLALVCLFYLSFTFVTNKVQKDAKTYAQGDEVVERNYLDSIALEKIYLGNTYRDCQGKELNLGLDLKGGMNIILELSLPSVLKSLSGNNPDENFNKALAAASVRQTETNRDYLDLFVEEYKALDPDARLSAIFSTFEMKGRIDPTSTDEQVIKVLKEDIQSAIDNSFNVLRTRIDRFGVVQPNIQRLETNGRILVELPGVKEPERVRKLLQGSANLEFWETYNLTDIYQNLIDANTVIRNLNAAAAPQEEAVAVAEAAKPEAVEATATTEEEKLLQEVGEMEQNEQAEIQNMEQWRKEYPLFSLLQVNQSESGVVPSPCVGYVLGRDTAKVSEYLNLPKVRELMPRDLKFLWSVKPVSEKTNLYELIAIKVSNRDGSAPLEGDVITDARDNFEQATNRVVVNMEMNAEGAKTWARLTKDNIGRSIAIVLDNYVYSYPRVSNEITGGRSEISGNFTVNEAKDLANVLKSGKMPAPARIVQEDIVGPSLGKEAIHSGLVSFIIAFVLILVYMVFFYGWKAGLIADFGLLCNVFFLMGILASFQAVLTLPGIAGIVLTLGMAIDTNVLIYERIKEELASGKNIKKAVTEGYKNAFSAIFDANLTTLMTGIVLFVFGTGPIKGFATTLIIGILTSFFCGVFLTRLIYTSRLEKDKLLDLTFTTKISAGFLRNPHFDFVGKRKVGYLLTCCFIVVAALFLGLRGMSQGIDFSGGRNYVVRFDQPVSTEEVRAQLADAFTESSLSVITIGGDNQVRISTNFRINENSETLDDEIEAMLYENLKNMLPEGTTLSDFTSTYIVSSQKVGPTVASDIKISAIWAVAIALVVIALYILFRFRNFAFSVGVLASLAHTVLFIFGIYSIFWGVLPFSLEIDQTFIAAILTIIGYAVNDTVVVFDRVRETTGLYPNRHKRLTMNQSLNSTLLRTFSTSLSTAIVLLAILFFGGDSIRGFAFAMLVGVIIGTYGTLFIACPLAYDIQRKTQKFSDEVPAGEE
ncbi:MAG: protein translocase subunit SecDF [Bacteroidales bacterium]|nr:protein translocase subunit SecDF [Bacteroidales bacterium]